jgi:hypothetical protein
MNKCIFIFFVLGNLCLCQQSSKYPYPIVGDGQTPIIFPATLDTFWVLKNSQYKKALANTDKLKITEEQISLMRRKVELSESIYKLKDSIIDTLRYGYDHYKEKWLQTDIKLEQAEIEASRNWMYFTGGTVIGIVITYLLIN